jgi:ribonuclease III
MPELEELESQLGYRFEDRGLLLRALTHKSRSYEDPEASLDNERMEFLGDSVLGFLTSAILFERGPELPEGKLSKLKSHLVSATHLYAVAQRLELGDYLLLGRSEEMSGGRAKRALLANALEALIAALYLDGGVPTCRGFVESQILAGVDLQALDEMLVPSDHKGALQELAQSRRLPTPRYSIVLESGPEHAKMFTVEARVGGEVVGTGVGPSKKAAAQMAAEEAFQALMEAVEETATEPDLVEPTAEAPTADLPRSEQ